ncbi:MAG: type IX secretion system membrane protein PorP/SprF [Bacteroidales bacterium]|nr:type IX secretion system membrane protein PorP/SprF [Bacteroidales bacterium]
MKRLSTILKLTGFLILLSIVEVVHGQQLPQYSQRNLNIFSYNPAFAGVKGYSEILLHHRSQWVGFEGAPVTQNLTYHGMLNRVMAYGISLVNDEIGPIRTTGIKLAYAHHIDFGFMKWSLGLAGEMYQFGLDGRNLNPYQPNDPAFLDEISDKVWRPEASAGTFFYNQHFYLGYSVNQLLGSTVKLYSETYTGTIPLTRHHYIVGSYTFSPARNIDLETSLLWGKTSGAPSEWELQVYGQYLGKILVGASYRLNDAASLVAGFKFFDRLKIAYSYDLVTSPLRNYNSGSHELIISYIIPNRSGKWNRWKHEYQYDFNPKTNKWKQRW